VPCLPNISSSSRRYTFSKDCGKQGFSKLVDAEASKRCETQPTPAEARVRDFTDFI